MNIENFLTKNNISVTELARQAKINQPTLWRIVNKKVRPSPDIALCIEKATNGQVTRNELLYPKEDHKAASA